MITDWFERLITLESDTSKKDYYLIFRDIDFVNEISLKDKYILLIRCSYTQAKRYALKRFYNRFESIYLKG